MAITFAKLFQPNVVDSVAPEVLYTVPAAPATNLLRNLRIRFVNTSSSPVSIGAWAVPPFGWRVMKAAFSRWRRLLR